MHQYLANVPLSGSSHSGSGYRYRNFYGATVVKHAQFPFRIGVKAWVTKGDSVLLVKERREDGSSFWTLPGGGVAESESLRDGLQRELKEEINAVSEIGQIVGFCDYHHQSRHQTVTRYAVYDATLATEPRSNQAEGVFDHQWSSPTELPPKTLTPFRHFIAYLNRRTKSTGHRMIRARCLNHCFDSSDKHPPNSSYATSTTVESSVQHTD